RDYRETRDSRRHCATCNTAPGGRRGKITTATRGVERRRGQRPVRPLRRASVLVSRRSRVEELAARSRRTSREKGTDGQGRPVVSSGGRAASARVQVRTAGGRPERSGTGDAPRRQRRQEISQTRAAKGPGLGAADVRPPLQRVLQGRGPLPASPRTTPTSAKW